MIILTGATGQLGSQVVDHLLEHVGPDQVGVSVRDPAKAQALRDRGVRVRRGDFADPASLEHAFEGATRVLVISANALGDEAVALNRAAIDAAVAAGAEHVLYTSHVGVDADSAFPPMRTHAATEALLAESGIGWTALRNGFYAASAPLLLGDAVQTGELRAPQDGPISWTAHPDLAAGAAAALAADRLDETVLALTAAEAVDVDGLGAIASELSGRPIRRVVISDDEYRDGLLAKGLPEVRADMTVGIFGASRSGSFARVEPTLAELIGRRPASVRTALEAHLA